MPDHSPDVLAYYDLVILSRVEAGLNEKMSIGIHADLWFLPTTRRTYNGKSGGHFHA